MVDIARYIFGLVAQYSLALQLLSTFLYVKFRSFLTGRLISLGQLAMALYSANPDATVYSLVLVTLSSIVFVFNIADITIEIWLHRNRQTE